MASSQRPASLSKNEPMPPSDILTRLDRVGQNEVANAITYVQDAYDQIIQNGYQFGSGNRELIKRMIATEEKNGLKLTRQLIDKLDAVLDIFEDNEKTLPSAEHENRYYLVGIYKTVAGSILDVYEEQADLDRAFQLTMVVCQLFSEKSDLNLDFFGQSISRYASNIHLSSHSTLQEKTQELTDLANGMGLLKLLIDKILNLEAEYTKKKWTTPKAAKTEQLRKFRESIHICALEAIKGNPEPEKWFYYLWAHVEGYAVKFADAKSTRDSGLFSPKLANILGKTILEDKDLREFAQHCAKFASTEFKAELEEKMSDILSASPASAPGWAPASVQKK